MKAEQFWAAVDRSAGPKACWPWTRAIKIDKRYESRSGYGMVQWNGSMNHAHRVALLLTAAPPDSASIAMHLCNNPPCCNPLHLKWGSPRENMEQMWAQGRGNPPRLRGEQNPKAKLTLDQVAEIRARYPSETQAVLAREFGVRQVAISRIVRGVTWRSS